MEGKKLGGRYEIVSRVGGGGMAVVYKAKDLLLNRFVAIKILSESLSNDSEFIRRFSREAQAAASLSHPNIVNVYDVGRDGYTHYIVMELVEGPTLKQYIQERGPLPVEEAANIAVQICDGLAHAHDNQIVHRDIKPHNILLGPNGRVKVTDFGIARAASSSTITQTGSVMGSVHYFSPEQARGGVIGEKSDIYSLGIVFYEMLTGHLPFDGDSAISIALKHLQDPVEDPRELNPEIPDNVAEIVLRALEKDPSMRYSSARAMMQDIVYAVRLDRRLEANWGNHRQPQQDFSYQTIPLGADDETGKIPVATAVETPPPYKSPTQRPEIRSGSVRNEPQRPVNPIGQQTMANLERLRNLPNDKDKTIFQRTVIWLENVQANMPWWQKLLFGLFTIILIGSLSIWGFTAIWGLISKGGEDETGGTEANATSITLPAFKSEKQARQFASKHGLSEPKIIFKPGEEGEVLRQEPAAGEKIEKGQSFTIYVGAGGVKVPNYRGEFETSIQREIAKGTDKLGYKLEMYRCDGSGSGYRRATMYKQIPEPGKRVEKGATVKVYSNIPGYPLSKCEEVIYSSS
ncbi:Stk1 family PASTA domain-containing Ser/Thr kinase [Lihuaxuella thermophila]|nr:Stk1 family PASTA domain-containing Ser/Thr kinase [Lihuaxuella thermophila]